MKENNNCSYAIVFPGQGSQYTGMGLELFQKFVSAKQVFETAEQISGLPIKDVCFYGSQEDLMNSSATQPCLLTTSMAIYNVFKEHLSVQPKYLCGHSAGQYSALVAAGVLSFADALGLIAVRGLLTSEASEGGMVAIKDITYQQAEELCSDLVTPGGCLVPANWNSPEQIVISGDINSIDSAVDYAFENNIKVTPLPVSRAFHSPLMQEAANRFTEHLLSVNFSDSVIPIISDVTAEEVSGGNEWSKLLSKQIYFPVLWEPSIRYLVRHGIETFVEIGPGNVLTKLIKKIHQDATVFNVNDLSSLNHTVAQLKSISL